MQSAPICVKHISVLLRLVVAVVQFGSTPHCRAWHSGEWLYSPGGVLRALVAMVRPSAAAGYSFVGDRILLSPFPCWADASSRGVSHRCVPASRRDVFASTLRDPTVLGASGFRRIVTYKHSRCGTSLVSAGVAPGYSRRRWCRFFLDQICL